MDTQLVSFELRTKQPEALERFLTEVLQLEIEVSPQGLFRAQFGNVSIDVFEGPGVPALFRVALSPESFANLAARWEFFTFRYAERPEVSFQKHLVLFTGLDGETWQVSAAMPSGQNEDSEIHVRNC